MNTFLFFCQKWWRKYHFLKNELTLNSFVFLLLFSYYSHESLGQSNATPIPNRVTPTGIFDIKSVTQAISKTTLREIDGWGESRYSTQKLPNGNLKVYFNYNKPIPNPQVITYSFEITPQGPNDYLLDMEAAMHPSALFIDTSTIKLSYRGDKIMMSNAPNLNDQLPDARGTFLLRRAVNDSLLISYEVAITNRKVSPKENQTLGEKNLEVYKHTYNYVLKTFLNGTKMIAESKETVEEVYAVGFGLVNQNRKMLLPSDKLASSHSKGKEIVSQIVTIH